MPPAAGANVSSNRSSKKYGSYYRQSQRILPPYPHNETRVCPPRNTSRDTGTRTCGVCLLVLPSSACLQIDPMKILHIGKLPRKFCSFLRTTPCDELDQILHQLRLCLPTSIPSRRSPGENHTKTCKYVEALRRLGN